MLANSEIEEVSRCFEGFANEAEISALPDLGSHDLGPTFCRSIPI